MEKPSFESIGNSYTIGQFIDYGDLNEQAEQQIKEAHKAGCEHVWNTHVVPLQEWKDEATAKLIEVAQACSILESENKALREEISDKSKTCADLTILLSKEMEKVNKLEEELVTTEKALRDQLEACEQHNKILCEQKVESLKEIERLKAELKNANSALDNISDMGHA